MTAKLGTVTLPYGVQEENPRLRNLVSISEVPLGVPILQHLGSAQTMVRIRFRASKSALEDIDQQREGSPMVTFDVGDAGKGDTDPYGVFVENINVLRNSGFPEVYDLDILAYKLDFDVENVSYDLLNGDFSLGASSQLVSPETDEQIDDYTTNLVLKSNKAVKFWVQYSSDKETWQDYPDDLGWELDAEKRIINLDNVEGYVRVMASNEGGESATISARLYLAKQI